MKKMIFIFITWFLLAIAFAQQDSFAISLLIYKDDRVEFKSFDISSEPPQQFPATGDYYFRIKSGSRQLYEAQYIISFLIHGHGEGPNGEPIDITEEADSRLVSLRFPFYSDADRIELYNKDKLIYTLDLRPHICNNNSICDANENADNCPSDCRQTTTTVPQQGGNNVIMLIAGVVLLVIGIAALYFLVRRRNASKENNIVRKLR